MTQLAVGYCCINLTLQKKKITYSRDMIKRTFDQRGISYASELAIQNAIDFIKVLEWNAQHGVRVFRMGSGIIPWSNHFVIEEMPDYDVFCKHMARAGDIIRNTGQRVTAHPDHFVKLASTRPDVVDNSIKELEIHAKMFDLLGLPKSTHAAINIHVGMNFSPETATRWCHAYDRLSDSVKTRLVVENDDKDTGFSVRQLIDTIYNVIKVPITFDYFHHTFHTNGLSERDAFELAYSTWSTTPLFHYSESKSINESVECNPRAHADFVYNHINNYGYTLDVDLEAKAKELALFKYIQLHGRT